MVCATLHREQVSDSAPGNGAGEKGKSRLSVLIVDDNLAAAQTLGWMLELFGHEVHLAHDGPEALRIAEDAAPQVVLMDLGLPGMSGYETCRRMRRLPRLGQTLFAAQTGWDHPQHRQSAQEAGFQFHLTKPVDVEALRGVLARASGAPPAE